jgi:hypothetical protein
LAGVLRVQGQKDDTPHEGWEEQQTSCPDSGLTENHGQTAQHSGGDGHTEKQCTLAHDASLSGWWRVSGIFGSYEREKAVRERFGV